MYIPVVLPAPYSTSIIHEELIYSDNFVEPKDLGKNIKATYISNVGEISLENCIKTIIEENKTATFHTIQYSKKNKKLCFYTDTELNIKKWKEKEISPLKCPTTQEEISKTILDVFDNQPIYDLDCISLYDILMLLRKINDKEKEFEDKNNKLINYKLKKIDKDLCSIIGEYDYNKKEIPLTFYASYWIENDQYSYSKNINGIIKENKKTGYHDLNVLKLISEEISNLIDFYESIKDYYLQEKSLIKAVNSNLYIDMDHYGIFVYIRKSNYYYNRLQVPFCASYHSYTEEPEYQYQYSDVLTKLQNHDNEFLQKIYVKIDDCPKWMQQQLYLKRHDEITQEIIKREQEEQVLKQELKPLQEEQPKRLSLFQKRFKKNKQSMIK